MTQWTLWGVQSFGLQIDTCGFWSKASHGCFIQIKSVNLEVESLTLAPYFVQQSVPQQFLRSGKAHCSSGTGHYHWGEQFPCALFLKQWRMDCGKEMSSFIYSAKIKGSLCSIYFFISCKLKFPLVILLLWLVGVLCVWSAWPSHKFSTQL